MYSTTLQLPSSVLTGAYLLSVFCAGQACQSDLPIDVTAPTFPDWASLRYTFTEGDQFIQFESTEAVSTLRFSAEDGRPLAGSNSDGANWSSGTDYPPGPLTNQSPFTKQWAFGKKSDGTGGVPKIPLAVTITGTSGQSFTYHLHPTEGFRTSLFTGSGGGTTPTNPGSYSRVLVFGNSITHHPPISAWRGGTADWGMDASEASKDYYHILKAYLQTLNSSVVVRELGDFSGLTVADGPYWEQEYATQNLSKFDVVANWQPDLIILRVAENVQGTANFGNQYKALIDKLKSQNSNAVVVLSTSVWNTLSQTQVDLSTIITQVGAERNYPVANLNNITGGTSGYQNHPNDAAMQVIADRIWAVIPKSTTPTVPSTPAAGYGNVYEANSNFVTLSEMNRPAVTGNYPRSYLGDNTSKIGVNLKAGSVIDFLNWSNSKNLVNSPIWGNGNLDAGRQIMVALYGYPSGTVGQYGEGHYTEAGQSTAQYHAPGEGSIGYNPVQGGDIGQNPSYGITHTFHNDGSVMYAKVQGKQWDMTNIAGKNFIEQWIKRDPGNNRAWRLHYRVTMFRDDSFANSFPTARQQEFPCFYTVADLREAYYCTGQPYTGASWTQYPFTDNSSVQPPKFSTEPFVAIRNSQTGRFVIMYTPHSGRVTAGSFNSGAGTSSESDFAANYVAATPMLHLDKDGVYDQDIALFEGTEAECRTWLYAQPRWSGLPEYIFTTPSRQGVVYHNCGDQREKNISNGLVITPLFNNENQGRDMNVTLPERWINGRTVKHLYMKYNITSSTGSMWLRWQKGPTGTDQFFQQFQVIADGQDHVVDINLENNTAWTNQDITQVSISHYGGSGYPAVTNDVWKIYGISYRNTVF